MSAKWMFVVIVILGIVGFSLSQSFQANAMHAGDAQALNVLADNEILSATLQIKISLPVDASGLRLRTADGLASLVREGDEILLVTHNHWGDVLQEGAMVEIFDASGRKVKSMSGAEFISLISYLDSGTLILRSPLEWSGQTQPVVEGDPHPAAAGDIVTVAQHGGPGRGEVTLVEARVESVTTIRGVPVYTLTGPEGQPVQPGDSGGGVWVDGKLAGNLWYTALVELTRTSLSKEGQPVEVSLEATQESYAAGYPAHLQKASQSPSDRIDSIETLAIP